MLGIADRPSQLALHNVEEGNRGLKPRPVPWIFRHGVEEPALIDRMQDRKRIADRPQDLTAILAGHCKLVGGATHRKSVDIRDFHGRAPLYFGGWI